MVPMGLHWAWSKAASRWRLLLASAGSLLMMTQVVGGIEKVEELHEDGRGSSSFAWRSSPAMAYIRDLPEIPI